MTGHRNKDLRLTDNRALALASATAERLSRPLVVLHIFSPSDYVAHDRSPRRIDFQLRALRLLQLELVKKNVPLFSVVWTDRKEVESKLTGLLGEWRATHLFGNIEYEVDELRRDEKVVRAAMEARKAGEGWGGEVAFVKDFCVVGPGEILTQVRLTLLVEPHELRPRRWQQGKPYSVYSPWYKNWANTIAQNPHDYLEDAGTLVANPLPLSPLLITLLTHQLPTSIPGFAFSAEDQATMNRLWPVGEDVCSQVRPSFTSAPRGS